MNSDKQKEIIESDSKNILVIACPGSGKTHTIVSRYIHLVNEKKVDPSSIILITFTNKAGIEMSHRIKSIIPDKMPYYVGSCHGLGYNLLKKFKPNYENNYTVMDRIDMDILLKECASIIIEKYSLQNSNIMNKIVTIYDILYTRYPLDLISTLKKLLIDEKYIKYIDKIIKKYNKIKMEQKLVDFNDLMYKLCLLLETKKADSFLQGINYIFFDEYQDINQIQFSILQMFKYSNKMVVGDDAQSIYSFRGSMVDYILNFEKHFENVKVYYLETNYRSTSEIINLFQDSIKNNTNQFKKDVKSANNITGSKPKIICSKQQYNMVVLNILKYMKQGIKLNDMVVLARTNKSLDMIELECMKYSIPVIKSNGINILNKNYIKDFIALLIVTINKEAKFYWKHIFNMHNINSIEYNFIELQNHVPNLYNLLKINPSIIQVKKYIEKLWYIQKVSNIENRIIDVNNIILYINNKIKTIPYDEFILSLYLDGNLANNKLNSSNEMTIDFTSDDNVDNIANVDNVNNILTLSTIHSCKGLEWDRVYIIDYFDDNTFTNNIMEERRLFYVALSRAKKHLIITSNDKSLSLYIRELNPSLYDTSPTTRLLLLKK